MYYLQIKKNYPHKKRRKIEKIGKNFYKINHPLKNLFKRSL